MAPICEPPLNHPALVHLSSLCYLLLHLHKVINIVRNCGAGLLVGNVSGHLLSPDRELRWNQAPVCSYHITKN